MTTAVRVAALMSAAGVFISACGDAGSTTGAARNGSPGGPAAAIEVAQVQPSAKEDVPSALDDPTHEAFPEPLVDPGELRSGGPPPDGIPPIDEPRFERAAAVDWLDDEEPVLALSLRGEQRAYPVQVLIWHEIVNDTVGGVPVAVTYCPLCNSALAFDRRVGGRVLDFGTSGQLYRSDLVMYDRQTESLWPQLLGQAAIGHLAGTTLKVYPMSTVAWADWREANSDGLVLSRDTGFERSYGTNPYTGYDNPERAPFLYDGPEDDRLPAMTRVVGLRDGDDAIAIVTTDLLELGVIDVEVAGRPVTVWAKPGTRSALEAATITGGRDVGASGAFAPFLDGRRLHFSRAGEHFVDAETGSRWTLLGEAVGGELAGERLEAVEHVDTFWFAWAAFLPDTVVVE